MLWRSIIALICVLFFLSKCVRNKESKILDSIYKQSVSRDPILLKSYPSNLQDHLYVLTRSGMEERLSFVMLSDSIQIIWKINFYLKNPGFYKYQNNSWVGTQDPIGESWVIQKLKIIQNPDKKKENIILEVLTEDPIFGMISTPMIFKNDGSICYDYILNLDPSSMKIPSSKHSFQAESDFNSIQLTDGIGKLDPIQMTKEDILRCTQ
jgi:hypothetical protein